jgi:chromate reductase, NAD(P)H dehydrogenase (quinone)
VKIVGISGSLRKGSFNTALLRACIPLMPQGVELEVGSIAGIPLYDGDLEAAHGIPAAVESLKRKIMQADGLLLVTPEYNNSMPGVLKNAVDWLSRPPADIAKVFGGRPVALMGASPGGFGTILSQNAWLPVLRTLGTRTWFGGKMMVSRAGGVFNEGGELTDETIRAQIQKYLAGFVAFIQG